MTEGPHRHVLTKVGDASAEVEAALRALGGAETAGLHQHLYVTRANQTVVIATGPESSIVKVLRRGPGWIEPSDAPEG